MKKIMVVDDKQDVIDTIKDGLETFSKEYEVSGANSGKECLDLLKGEELPDLIILDIIMPEMSGWDVFAKLKEDLRWRNIPIVILTVKTDPVSKGLGKISADDYIEKPFGIVDLKNRIDKVLSG